MPQKMRRVKKWKMGYGPSFDQDGKSSWSWRACARYFVLSGTADGGRAFLYEDMARSEGEGSL